MMRILLPQVDQEKEERCVGDGKGRGWLLDAEARPRICGIADSQRAMKQTVIRPTA